MARSIHIGDKLRWSEAVPGRFSVMQLRDADQVVATFRKVHRLGSAVAEGEFRSAHWRLRQHGVLSLRYVLTWLDAMEGVAPSTTFEVSAKGLSAVGGPGFSVVIARRGAPGGWARGDGELVLESNEHEAAMGYFWITSAGSTEPLLPELLITSLQFARLQAQRDYAEYQGVTGAIDLAFQFVLHLMGR